MFHTGVFLSRLYLIHQYRSPAYFRCTAFTLCFLCVCLCQCCISNTDKTYKIAFVRSSGSSKGFGVCLFICVIKSQAQQGKWKPHSLDKMICWCDTSSGPREIHTTPTYLQAVAEQAATLGVHSDLQICRCSLLAPSTRSSHFLHCTWELLPCGCGSLRSCFSKREWPESKVDGFQLGVTETICHRSEAGFRRTTLPGGKSRRCRSFQRGNCVDAAGVQTLAARQCNIAFLANQTHATWAVWSLQQRIKWCLCSDPSIKSRLTTSWITVQWSVTLTGLPGSCFFHLFSVWTPDDTL